MLNLYELLGIKKNANLNTIRKAFRRKALIVHPDRNKSPDATENFREIANAYEVLSDPQQRTNYDKTLFVSTTTKTQETKEETKKPRDPSPPKKEESKKYKKYSPSENSFNYPLEEKWTIDKIETLNNKALNKVANVLLLLIFSICTLVTLFSLIDDPCEGKFPSSHYCPGRRNLG